MPEFFAILIKVNIALLLFCAGYYLVLRKLTFYTLNRAYLVTGILFSSAYPFINLSALAQRHQQIVAPVQNIVIYWKAPAESLIKEASYWSWLEMLFWVGVTVFALRLAFQLISLYKIYSGSTEREINGQTVRVVKGDISPFSFWQSIYVNPEKLSPTDLNNILEHEQIHVKEWHTLDVLLTEIGVVFYWFNPGIWMMKKAVRENIEFITDRKILQKGLDSKAYQYSLLNITFNHSAPAITSNFNFSTLKKRIMMMNAKRSSNLNLTRYAFLMPAVVVCLFVFSLSKTEAVKANPIYQTITATVKNLSDIALHNDTTPVNKAVAKPIAQNIVLAMATDKKEENPTAIFKITPTFSLGTDSMGVLRLNHKFSIQPISKDSVIIIVDGKIVPNLNNINPNTIEGVTILKDRASWEDVKNKTGVSFPADVKISGIILINTKQGANGAVTIRPGVNEVTVTGYGNNGTRPANEVTVNGYRANGPKAANEVIVTGYGIDRGKPIDSISKANNWLTFRGLSANEKMPLVVVDGKEMPIESREALQNKVDANTIQNVSILKDASATQIYGEKGKNGVIVITTKKN